ncbi:MAG: FAD:protein FMN transferase [Solimonas sp.]
MHRLMSFHDAGSDLGRLGGIAKGYAVDCATARLQAHGIEDACVDAGGDLCVIGRGHPVRLRVDGTPQLPLLLVDDGAVASSGGDRSVATPHFHASGCSTVGAERFACVTAPSCMIADALTKLVLALGIGPARLVLDRYGASAYSFSPAGGWQQSTRPT